MHPEAVNPRTRMLARYGNERGAARGSLRTLRHARRVIPCPVSLQPREFSVTRAFPPSDLNVLLVTVSNARRQGTAASLGWRTLSSLIHAASGSGTPVARCQPVVSQESRNRRQHPRTRVSWPVVVETATQRYPCQVMDISNHGAKITTRARLRAGAVVRLQIIPPDGTPLRVGALFWRVDTDGVAFFFARSIHHRFIRAA